MTARASWPSDTSGGYYPDDDRAQDQAPPDQGSAQAVIGEMAWLLRDTRGSLLMGGGVLCAITVGFAMEAAFSADVLRLGVVGVLNIALLCGLMSCWLRAVTLLALAGRPTLNAVSELRWATGAPVDPRASWLSLPPVEAYSEDWTWIRAHLLIGAARLARHRLQFAETWTYITAVYFLIWTTVLLLGL
jgi:hypothetical protein